MTDTTADLRDRIAEALYPTYGQEDRNRSLAIADAVLAVLPPPVDRTAVLREAADAVFALDYDVMVGEEGDENMGSMREAWDVGTIHATQLLRRMADEAQPAFQSEVHAADEDSVACWHTEPDTPCDWNVCRQPGRLAAGDRGTDPAKRTTD
jgi:hypothetical protein